MIAVTFAALFVLGLALPQQTPPADRKPDPTNLDAAVEWLRQHAIPFTSANAGSGFEDLAPLAKLVGDARIVALGEPTHGTREAFMMKHRLLEFLVEEKGFSIFSIEANMPEAYALNEYVIEGKGDPRRLIGGMYFWTWNTEEVLAMVEWMRAWNQRRGDRAPLQFTGFDMQTPTVAAEIAGKFVATHAPDLSARAAALADVKNLANQGRAEGFNSATGTFPAAAAQGKKLVLSGWIKTADLEGWAGLWWRCDTPKGKGAFDNMSGEQISGTTDWQRYELTLEVDADTENINFGCLMAGTGTAWFDDVEITLDGVKQDLPEARGLNFEGDEECPLYLDQSRAYQVRCVASNPHGGKRCLEIHGKAAAADESDRPDGDATVAAVHETLDALRKRRDDLAQRCTPRDADWAVQNVRVVAQCARMLRSDNGSSVRDEAMAENVAWILEQNPRAKIVLWAHNGHVSRGQQHQMRRMGSHLEERFPGQMVVFGFATGQGTYTAIDGEIGRLRSDNQLQAPPADSLEALLTRTDLPNAIVDLRLAKDNDSVTAWATVGSKMRSIGALAMKQQFYECVPRQMFDVVLWQRATTASVPLGR